SMAKYSKWAGLLATLFLVVSCFLPWTYHADIDKVFTGFFSEKNVYGKPGKFLVFTAALIAAGFIIPRVWAKRTNLFVSAISFAYALKSFFIYASCYRGYCPEKKLGIWLMLTCSFVMMVMAVFPDLKIKKKEDGNDVPSKVE
ncbi:MAG: hypothetical protein SFU87_12225, partial [Chitinophagaceae bacterium]|nr:hypothetical protein [Chitinophagaceae bacterium]